MSEVHDKRRLVDSKKLEHMQKMRAALAEKNRQKKEAKLNPKPVEEKIELEPIQEQVEDEEEEIEVPIPVKRTKKVPIQQPHYDFEDTIRQYVEKALPDEFKRENMKKRKWEMRKQEIKNEILQSLHTPQPSEAAKINVAKPALDLKDLFSNTY